MSDPAGPEARTIAEAGNGALDFGPRGSRLQVEAADGELLQAVSPSGRYLGADPVQLLGLKLVEPRGWSWQAEDDQIDSVMERFRWVD